ncbi:UDP-N-acetylglucosamine--undecaprenyl-phosphate N-acetylglucosaminephosphotransferase [Shewanella ulleungensis]|jgi:UDP-GlcNAc:undecaprenyl-phosphate GlcNAc-1-phosphate transferase|uniref:Undecaprenyl-phosphate alpha-N-acetylglucosaminyl 1-phosphate transferase n=1 Tax=Shewanella ulleungensis TaxID=2282699 RepID=A0ABQ2QME0_9GAMM|nr:UDP-N-acetylglucosamine--undecaprenyl-phosphate N-acetylglucosaminephosphotransferase [Shewanella ulleungensis]MCL1149865.1 UDP-N-acetylglucosamine--undecaprenyl-phosphate N-acetylglucosaminephosphotransferase [Shewanella ulleungensis]GGP85160.1 undecaprenyl-phosphate alpha-N-acetylglucosaminyl 1-phosphate transferase [Shewanella ulleungensis]
MDYWFPVFVTFLVSFFAIKLVKPLAVKTGLLDYPCERKVHDGHIPLVGGIAIYLSVLITSMVFIEHSQNLNIYLVAAALVLFLGALDDRYLLSVKVRLVSQIIVASLMIFGTETYLQSFGTIFGFFELHLGYTGAAVSVIAIIAGINAINMMDGIDGLAGALSLIAFGALAFLLSRFTNEWYLLPVLFIAALLAYLLFNLNLHHSFTKVFMGDSGNMFIGLTIVWLMIVGTELDTPAFRPVTALYIIAIPLIDMVSVMIRRMRSGGSPFTADRQHLHHLFEALGYSRRYALVAISCVACLFAFIGCLAEIYFVPEWILFTFFILLFTCYSLFTQQMWDNINNKKNN